jgi:hypothetical protein
MARKDVKPPFVPNQSGSLESTDCIDPEFTGQEVKLTYQVKENTCLCICGGGRILEFNMDCVLVELDI